MFYKRRLIENADDITRIREIARADGLLITPEQAIEIWEEHSDRYAAGWLFLPDADEHILPIVRMIFRELYLSAAN